MEQHPSLSEAVLMKATSRFRSGWHLDIDTREQKAFWISPEARCIEIPFEVGRKIVTTFEKSLDAVYAPGHAYYVIEQPSIYPVM
ncbi:MAG: hypothetical protein ACE5G0_19445 [Rhodothermales bacterium]